jgi:hypothetical protein
MAGGVEEYIAKQASPQREICERLRAIILKTFPEIAERMKLGVTYYDDDFYLVALKTHVNLGVALTSLPKAEAAKLKGGGKTTRHLEFADIDDIDEAAVVRLLRLARG